MARPTSEHSYKTCRVRISGLHFAKCEGIISFWEALSKRNNKNTRLSISFLAPKFHLVTIIFKQDNVLQKHLISWHDLSLWFLSHSVLYNRNRPENYKTVSVCLLCTLNILIWYSTKVFRKMFVEFFEMTKIMGEESPS